jgi:hypothetical protein
VSQDYYIQSYSFGLSTKLALGEPKDFSIREWTMRAIQPRLMVTNAPCPNFVVLERVEVDAILLKPFLVDGEYASCDAFVFSVDAAGSPEGEELGAPLCDHGATMVGRYSGLVPKGYSPGYEFTFCLTLWETAEFAMALDGRPRAL